MRSSLSDRDRIALAVACALAGALGLAPGAAGARDAVTLLGWLALSAPALGAACAASGLAPLVGACVPLAWGLALALARAPRELDSPALGLCAAAGLFALGWALGQRSAAPARAAGRVLLLTLLFAGASVGFGLVAGGGELSRAHPLAAARLLDASPLCLVLECAGWDWTHAQPAVYAESGVEWFLRRPYPGNLAAPAVLVVGCALAWLARASRPAPVR